MSKKPTFDTESERLKRLAEIVASERQIEAATRTAYRKLLAQIARDVLDQKAPIISALGDPNANRNQINAAWLLLLINVKRPILALLKRRRRSTGAPTTYDDRAITPYGARITDRLRGVPNEVYADLDRIIADGIKHGLTEQEIKQRLKAELTPGNEAYNRRLEVVSQRVARTEATAAFNAGEESGQLEVQQESGARLTKTWLSQRDGKVRETHIEADGQTVDADQTFDVGGYQARFPGDWTLPPEESVNCRCTAIYSTNNQPITAAGAAMTTPTPIRPNGFPNGWTGVMAGLDIVTGDGRYLATPEGGVRTREYPLSLTLDHVGEGDAPVIGSVDRVWVQDGLLYGEGKLDLGGEEGMNFARQLIEGYINTVSIHPDQVVAELQMVDPEGNVVQEPQAVYERNDYALPEGYTERLAFTDWRLAGLAVVPIPAYTEARIEGVYNYVPTPPQPGDALVAAVGGQVFKKEFFEYRASGPTKMTVTDDGHIYGHVRFHGTCYQYGQGRGDGGYCIEPPLSACGYAKFHAHSAILDDGSVRDVGALTFGDGHESRGGLIASRAHYDNVATIAAKVVACDDEWGVFVTGEVLDAYKQTAHDLLLSPLSGHWEPDADNNGHLEMLAAHIVVTPGYSVRRIVASFDGERNATSIIVTTVPNAAPARKPQGPRGLVAAAMADHKRAARAAKRAGVDPASRLERALARIAP